MVAPINYAIDVQSPIEAALQGAKLGAGFAEINAAQRQREQQMRMQEDLSKFASNPAPTYADYASISLKYPQLAEKFKSSWDIRSEGDKQAKLSSGLQVYSALQAGKPEIAQSLLSEQAAAYRNSGNEAEAKAAETAAKLIEVNPQAALTTSGLYLSSVMGDKFADVLSKLGGEQREQKLFPVKEREAVAKAGEAESTAQKAAVAAKFAESDAALDLQKKGWDITKIQEDIKIAKANSQIAAMQASISREANTIKREENMLKLEEMRRKLATEVREKAADVESARFSMDNMLNTADRILKTPKDVVGSAAGPVSSRIPTTTQSTADFESLVDTLGSQAFLAQIPNIKGMGALSNAEGEKLQAALQNFSLKQSPEQLLKNVREAQRLILKARSNLTTRYGVPDTVPDTPEAPGAGGGGKSADEILRELGVM